MSIRIENIIIGSKDDIYNHLNEKLSFKERNEQTSKLSGVNFDGYGESTVKQQLDLIDEHNSKIGLVCFLSQEIQGEETVISFKKQFVLIQDKEKKWDRDFYEVNRNT